MDLSGTKFDWNKARAFLFTAEQGSLSAASRALGMTQPTLGRQVDALEKELQVVLFERVGRGLMLTPAGEQLLEHVRAMGDAANRVALVATGQSQSLQGKVSIAASETVAAYLIKAAIQRLRQEEPGIQIELVTGIKSSDLIRREADIAIRHYRTEEPELIARNVGVMQARLYASSAYLDRLGRPETAEDYQAAQFLCFEHESIDAFISMYKSIGLQLDRSHFGLLVANELVAWEMVKAGLAIGVIEEAIGDNEPTVERVLPSLGAIEAPLWLTCHRELRSNRRVRRVYDVLAEALTQK